MDLIQILILAIGLSMDSLIIALASGAIIGKHKACHVLKIAGTLASVQMLFTVVGWMVGASFVEHINRFDHWIAFAILVFLGGKIIFESFKGEEEESSFDPLKMKVMFTLAVATSIDALAVGLSLSLVNKPILQPAIIVGLVTLLFASTGVIFGSKVGQRYNFGFNILGGVILILIGGSILVNHTILA